MASSFSDLGFTSNIVKSCNFLKWSDPTQIQELTAKPILDGRNLVALAETGSGKTGAYALPILQKLMENPSHYFALILTPTRELAMQVQQQFMALGKSLGLSVILLVGGIPISEQAKLIKTKPPHVIIATPGRLIDHIKKTKGFDEIKLKTMKFLVIDEADRMMGSDFEKILERILSILPRERQTLLFSATMSDKVSKLTKAAVRDPVRISTRKNKFQSISKLSQFVYLLPQCQIDCYLICLLRYALGTIKLSDSSNPEDAFPSLAPLRLNHDSDQTLDSDNQVLDNSCIVFTRKKQSSNRLALLLRQFINSPIIALNGDMPQPQRIGALAKFKKTPGSILVATDIASRGLDIPLVGLVINYDVPLDAKTYMHRIGRTARAGREGCALTLLTQYSVVFYIDEIEKHLTDTEGKTAFKVPSLLKPDSEEDKRLEQLVDDLEIEVQDASIRSKKAVADLSKGKRKGVMGAFTSVQDVKTPLAGQVTQHGLKSSQWASEASQERKKEIERVMAAVSTDKQATENQYSHVFTTSTKKRKSRASEKRSKKPRKF
ncbi:putative ATP-dependent RNA helicase ddx49 [Cichlidogyrus casuarinus]|uniref:RNA helicase n=1 Tax=Cichlidogyrus casuarinus TaxID=1844966 RepID=A0ABD2Q6N2_9PLAT